VRSSPTAARWLLAIAALSVAGVAAALVSQHVFDMPPCPWCVLQRAVYLAIAALCLIGAALPVPLARRGAGALAHPFEHARRQILGKDPALRPHHWCHAHHIIAAASADIGHRHAGLYAGDADHVGGFPRLVARSFLTPG
jgi:disulfide bond formation protein DsbB